MTIQEHHFSGHQKEREAEEGQENIEKNSRTRKDRNGIEGLDDCRKSREK